MAGICGTSPLARPRMYSRSMLSGAGTPEPALRHYLARWNETWLDSYSVNAYKLTPREERLEATVKELQAEVAQLRAAQRDL